MQKNRIKKLCECDGIPGHEEKIYQLLKNYLVPYCDEVYQDQIGSLVGLKKAKNSNLKVMLAAHLDEVGFIVKVIDQSGFVYFEPAGGWVSHVMLAQKVCITTRQEKKYFGIIGSLPPHVLTKEQRREAFEITDMFIDLGVESKEEVIKLGIKPGDMITPVFDFFEMNNPDYLAAKAFDNRIGCAILIEIVEKLKNKKLMLDLYSVATVQEEVGLKGARTSTSLINPDIAIAIDVGISADTPNMTIDHGSAKMGHGPLLVIMDATILSHCELVKRFKQIADEYQISLQFELMQGGGTDAGNIHLVNGGTPSLTLGIPSRYIHSHASVINQRDADQLVNLIVAFISEFNQEQYLKIIDY